MVNTTYLSNLYRLTDDEIKGLEERTIVVERLPSEEYMRRIKNVYSELVKKRYLSRIKNNEGFAMINDGTFRYNSIIEVGKKRNFFQKILFENKPDIAILTSDIVFRKEDEIIKGPYASIVVIAKYYNGLKDPDRRTIEKILEDEGFECLNCDNVFVF